MDLQKVYSKVFGWMFVGLLLTFLTGYSVSNNLNMLMFVFSGYNYLILAIVEIGLCIFFTARITKMSPTTAKICFILYSIVSGLTFSSIFIVYEISSVIYVFFITAILFGVFALIGHYTSIDLTKFSTIVLMLLVGIIICSIVNMFINNETFDLVITIISVAIFLFYTAYDLQKIKRMLDYFPSQDNLAIYGALELYLDFINLFLDLIRLFGKKND